MRHRERITEPALAPRLTAGYVICFGYITNVDAKGKAERFKLTYSGHDVRAASKRKARLSGPCSFSLPT